MAGGRAAGQGGAGRGGARAHARTLGCDADDLPPDPTNAPGDYCTQITAIQALLQRPILLAPLSTAPATTRQPTLEWWSCAGARVEVCADRSCNQVLSSVDVSTHEWTPPSDLTGNGNVYFWRVTNRIGDQLGTISTVWEVNVPEVNAPTSSWGGSVLDYNLDGLADLAVGAYDATPTPGVESGAVYIYAASGRDTATPIQTLVQPIPQEGSLFGATLSNAGDVNGDGFGDLLVGANNADDPSSVATGAAYVFFGGASGFDPVPSELYGDANRASPASAATSNRTNGKPRSSRSGRADRRSRAKPSSSRSRRHRMGGGIVAGMGQDPRCNLIVFFATSSEEKAIKQASKAFGGTFVERSHDQLGTYYDLGSIGSWSAIAVRTDMGSIGESGSAAKALYFQVLTGATALAGVGMAFGASPEWQRPGDVLVSTSIIAYDYRLITDAGAGYVTDYGKAPRYPAKESLVQTLQRAHYGGGLSHEVFFGALVSGAARISSAAFRDEVIKGVPCGEDKVVGGEMEGVGFLTLLGARADPRWVVVKGISDFAEHGREATLKANRPVACANAALFLFRALATPPPELA